MTRASSYLQRPAGTSITKAVQPCGAQMQAVVSNWSQTRPGFSG